MAYGKVRGISKPLGSMPARLYPTDSNSTLSHAAILTVPFDFNAGDELGSVLTKKLYNDFNGEIEDGRTYPQEDVLEVEGFEAYFASYDLIIGFFLDQAQLESIIGPDGPASPPAMGMSISPSQMSNISVANAVLNDISSSESPQVRLPNPNDTYAFAYYIKPNYPGRSSHLCNAGFLVPIPSRGVGLGRVAGRSFLYYGPRAGYRGSVFNLVYATNEASVRIWERLGFQNVGRIPEAGRLKKPDGNGETFVDAWVVHGDFTKIGYRDP